MYFIKVNDDTKIAVEDINRSSNKVVVLVHGWPISKEMFEYQKNALVEIGCRVVSYDIRGFGNSEASSENYNYDQLATDLWCVIDNTKASNITLMGFSMGGAICIHYMNMYDGYNIGKLILAGTAAPSFVKNVNNPYGNTLESVNELINQAHQDRPQLINDFKNKVFALNHSKSFLNWFHDLCLKASGIGTIKSLISLRDEDVFNELSKIKIPTLIMHGKLDKICPYGFAITMNEQIPNSELISFDYSGHGLFYDENDKFNAILTNFIEK